MTKSVHHISILPSLHDSLIKVGVSSKVSTLHKSFIIVLVKASKSLLKFLIRVYRVFTLFIFVMRNDLLVPYLTFIWLWRRLFLRWFSSLRVYVKRLFFGVIFLRSSISWLRFLFVIFFLIIILFLFFIITDFF